MKKLTTILLVGLLSLVLLTACGGKSGEVKELTVEMGPNGEMAFVPDVLEANEGDTLKITLVNKDPAVAHNFLIPALGVNSGQVPAGQSSVIEVRASQKGEHEIICDVPGHLESGMKGKLIVK